MMFFVCSAEQLFCNNNDDSYHSLDFNYLHVAFAGTSTAAGTAGAEEGKEEEEEQHKAQDIMRIKPKLMVIVAVES